MDDTGSHLHFSRLSSNPIDLIQSLQSPLSHLSYYTQSLISNPLSEFGNQV